MEISYTTIVQHLVQDINTDTITAQNIIIIGRIPYHHPFTAIAASTFLTPDGNNLTECNLRVDFFPYRPCLEISLDSCLYEFVHNYCWTIFCDTDSPACLSTHSIKRGILLLGFGYY